MLFSGQHVNMEEYTPSAPPAEGDICWQAAHNSPQVIIVFSTGRGEYSYLEFIKHFDFSTLFVIRRFVDPTLLSFEVITE